MKKQAESWLNAAYDDLAVVKEIHSSEHLTNMAAFHCQQAVEKSLKAILEEYEGKVPRLHDIITLRQKVLPYLQISVDPEVYDQLNELYIESRYPADLGLTPCGKPSVKTAGEFYKLAEEIFINVKEFLNNK